MAEWSARRTRNPAVPGSSLALSTVLGRAGFKRLQIGKWLPPASPVILYLNCLFLSI